ncbi:unnamed protein product [Diabrotica balteata]|uniref:glutathione transferase n=1 Tax=Diabrotica balteata TaxID=107213 RepID=A0A9N9XIK5_DIABA|nr:unnamed protein product [Diabrotica balteata]
MPTYKVRYFDIAGRGEPIRMILSYGQIPFIDERISNEDWSKIKPTTPLGQVPVLEIDGKQIPHCIPICRYLASIVNLAGSDATENLAIDVAVETLVDLGNLAYEVKRETDAAKKQEKENKFKQALSLFLGKLDEYAQKHGGYIALPRLSWADIVFTCSYEALMNKTGVDTFNPYPSLQKVKNNVLAQPGIKEWVKKRPANPMYTLYNLKEDLL